MIKIKGEFAFNLIGLIVCTLLASFSFGDDSTAIEHAMGGAMAFCSLLYLGWAIKAVFVRGGR